MAFAIGAKDCAGFIGFGLASKAVTLGSDSLDETGRKKKYLFTFFLGLLGDWKSSSYTPSLGSLIVRSLYIGQLGTTPLVSLKSLDGVKAPSGRKEGSITLFLSD